MSETVAKKSPPDEKAGCNDPSCGDESCDCTHAACPCRPLEKSAEPVDDLPTNCPKCGSLTGLGYGLAGGGFGPYVACLSETCDFFSKRHEDHFHDA